MATLQSLGSVAGLINLDYGKFKYAVDQMRTSADGINGNVEERARGAERSEALDEFAEQFVQLQRIISLYKSLIKKDIDAIETTGEQLKEIDLKLEGVWKGLQMGLPCIFGFNIWSDFNILGKGVLDLEDFVVSNLLLPIGAMVYLLFCTTKFGWGFDNYFEECNTGKGLKLSRVLKPYLKYALPVLIVIVFVQGFIG